MHNTELLSATFSMDFHHPLIRRFIERHTFPGASERETAVALYYAVRDDIRYDPYRIDLSIQGLRASTSLQLGYGWCVSKAVLLAACCRAKGLKARLGFADVKNHLSTPRLRDYMQTDVFLWHGYTEILLADQWVKATPAFNKELCKKANVPPLEFDGLQDSTLQPFDLEGNKYMEYLNERGHYNDLPLGDIQDTLKKHHRQFREMASWDFDADISINAHKH